MLLLRPMIRMTFCSRIEKERGDTDSSGSYSCSSALFHPGELCERRLRSSERDEEALRFTENGGAGATSTLGAAADVELDMRVDEPSSTGTDLRCGGDGGRLAVPGCRL